MFSSGWGTVFLSVVVEVQESVMGVASLPRRTAIHTVLHTLWILWTTLWAALVRVITSV